ncbi:hypothetical protein GCM10023116_20620 [Kistimonas scapharcae]|uniref:Transposase n=1 Tax=Kistimonas scapharcae TaxID=1036133 RepID=A0ABP8V1H0_9GAMM
MDDLQWKQEYNQRALATIFKYMIGHAKLIYRRYMLKLQEAKSYMIAGTTSPCATV